MATRIMLTRLRLSRSEVKRLIVTAMTLSLVVVLLKMGGYARELEVENAQFAARTRAIYGQFTVNVNGDIVEWTKDAERVTGHAADHCLHRPLARLLPPETRFAYHGHFDELLNHNHKSEYRLTGTLIGADGRYVAVQLTRGDSKLWGIVTRR